MIISPLKSTGSLKYKAHPYCLYFASLIAFVAILSITEGAINFSQRPNFPLKDVIKIRSRFSTALMIKRAHLSAGFFFPYCLCPFFNE